MKSDNLQMCCERSPYTRFTTIGFLHIIFILSKFRSCLCNCLPNIVMIRNIIFSGRNVRSWCYLLDDGDQKNSNEASGRLEEVQQTQVQASSLCEVSLFSFFCYFCFVLCFLLHFVFCLFVGRGESIHLYTKCPFSPLS